MYPWNLTIWICTAALAGCAVPSGQSAASAQSTATSTVESSIEEKMPPNLVIDLPADACTQEGYWSFFEAFVRSSEVRSAYTDSNVKNAIDPFRIALVDDQWVYVETDGPGQEFLRLEETRNGDHFRVEYVRAEFGADDEIIKTHGKPGLYEFQLKAGCWRLTNATP